MSGEKLSMRKIRRPNDNVRLVLSMIPRVRIYAFPRRRRGKVAPAGQSRDVKASPLANILMIDNFFVGLRP